MAGFYSSIAKIYDKNHTDFDYSAYADLIQSELCANEKVKTNLLLDLGCGTGTLTFLLHDRGYDMTAVDLSEEMLSIAHGEASKRKINDILFLCQDMRKLDLYGTVDACVCTFDALNYLTTAEDLGKTFALLHNYLIPNGILIFDMNTPHCLAQTFGNQTFVTETERTMTVWQNEYHEKSKRCRFYLSTFEETENGLYRRTDEVQEEKCYSLDTVKRLLSENGFELCSLYGGLDKSAPTEQSDKWYFTVRNLK